MSYESGTVAEINAYNQLFYNRPQAVGIIMDNDQGHKKHPNEILIYAIISLQERVEAGWDGEGLGRTDYITYGSLISDKDRKGKRYYSNQEIAEALVRIGRKTIMDTQGNEEKNGALIEAISRVLQALESATKAGLKLDPIVALDRRQDARRARSLGVGPS